MALKTTISHLCRQINEIFTALGKIDTSVWFKMGKKRDVFAFQLNDLVVFIIARYKEQN
jgi:hypothetical protein